MNVHPCGSETSPVWATLIDSCFGAAMLKQDI